MKINLFSVGFVFCLMVLLPIRTIAAAANGKLDSAKIEQLTGVKGELNDKEAVFTVRAPRTDLQVTTAGVKMNPAMGVNLLCGFYEDQVSPVMSAALDNGL